tara:strand:- start:18 stop:665 length:648 start_codon:yes stop_codon:yes gene_type:complete
MRKLFIPLLAAIALPNAINAFPFGKNLEFKNDIGTKYLIKGDAVYSKYLVAEDLKKAIKNFQSEAFDLYWDKTQYEKKGKKSDMDSYKLYVKGGLLEKVKDAEETRIFWKNSAEQHDLAIKEIEKKYVERNNEAKKSLEKLEDDQTIKIHAVNLSFNPILIDLNNNQSVEQEITISCLNQELSEEIRQIWIDYYPLKGGEGERQLAICKKYAKFK